MNIGAIAALADGAPVDSISGIIENVYERHTGKNSKGRHYSLQNAFVKDQTGKIKVLLDGRKEWPKSLEGKAVTVSAVRGSNGLEGVFAKDDNYKGNSSRIVKVTDVAKVTVSGGNGSAVAPTAASTQGSVVHGQTVGMAINNATRVLVKAAPDGKYWFTPEFEDNLREIAGVYLRVSKELEFGVPAPKPAPTPEPEDNFLKNDDPSDF